MKERGLQRFISELEKSGELIRIKGFVNPELEITEIADRMIKQPNGGKALLFENTGTGFPVLINAFGSEKRIHTALQVQNMDELTCRIDELFGSLTRNRESFLEKIKILPQLAGVASFLPRKVSGKALCQEEVHLSPDLSRLPVLTCWPFDGGPFITLPLVHTVDPDSKVPNLGMYRMQVFSKTTTGMHWHKHKVGARHYRQHKSSNTRMPVTVTLGGDPVYTYAATAPVPDNFDEYILAGFIRKKAVTLVKSITNDIYVPADSDIVIEGYIDPAEDFVLEGPFGDHTGFYSLADLYPVFHVTCITHRKNATYPATIVGIPPMEDAQIGRVTEKLFFKPIKFSMLPELTNMHLPVAGVAHNLAIVSADISYEGHAFKIAHSLWGAGQMMFTKYIVVVNTSVHIYDYNAVFNQFLSCFRGEEDLLFSKGPMDVLEHSTSEPAVGGKLCIDATRLNRGASKTVVAGYGFDEYIQAGTEYDTEMILDGLLLFYTIDFRQCKLFTEKVNSDKPLVVLAIEPELKGLPLGPVAWYVMGNTDPVRDIEVKGKTLIIDGTRKHSREGFNRNWPDLTIMNDETISAIDSKWEKVMPVPFIQSPSLPFKLVAKEKGAHL